MKRLTTPTKLVASAEKFESTRYSLLVNDVLTEYRLKHLLNDVIPNYTAIRPQFLFNGELEAILLRPLVALAQQFLYAKKAEDRPAPGFVTKHFLIMARRYALVAEITNLAGVKSALNVLGDELITASHLATFFKTAANEGKSADEIQDAGGQSAVLLKYLVGNNNTLDDDMVGKFIAGGATSVIDPSTQEDAFASTFELLQTYAGAGRGVPMSMAAHRTHINSFEVIETAIAATLDGNIRFQESNTTDSFLADGYAMAVAYLIYLHHSQSMESYDMLFPASQRSALASTKLAHIANTARRSAWFFAGLSSAPAIFDLVALLDLTQASLKFLNPIMDMEISQYKDVAADISAAQKVLHANTVSPVQYHCEQILMRLKKISGADEILPNFVKHLFHIPMPEFNDDVLVPQGFSGLAPDFMTRFSISSSSMMSAFVQIAHVVRLVRRASEEIAYTMSSFHLSSEYDPNAMNVPNSLFDLKDSVVSAKDIQYISPIKKDILPLSIPRYSVPDEDHLRPKRVRQWSLKPYQYATVNLIAMRQKLRATKTRLVFDRGLNLPLANTIASRFAKLPIPMPYLAECFLPSVANTAADVMELMKGNNVSLTASSMYFDDIASIIASSPLLRPSIANALAGLCRIFHVPAGASAKDFSGSFTHIVPPSIPFIYGMPGKAFLGIQPHPEQYVDDDGALAALRVSMPISDGSTVEFLLHTKVPKPMNVIYANAMLEDGVMATIPIGLTWYTTWKSKIFDYPEYTSIAGGSGAKDKPVLSKVISAIAAVSAENITKTPNYEDLVMTVDAWSPVVQYFPHLFYTVSDPSWRTPLLMDDLDKMCHVGLYTRLVPGARAMMVLGLVDDYLALIEPSDVLDLAESEDKSLDSVTAVELTEDKGSKPSSSGGGATHTPGPSLSEAERIVPLASPPPTAGELRDVTSNLEVASAAIPDTAEASFVVKGPLPKTDPAKVPTTQVTSTTTPDSPEGSSPSTTLAGDTEEDDEEKKKKKKKKSDDEIDSKDTE